MTTTEYQPSGVTVPYGEVNPLADAARYTTVDTIKARLRIPLAQTAFDARILEAVIAAEYALDVELGRSFPDEATPPDEDPPTGPPIVEAVPAVIVNVATDIAVAVYKAGDAPGIAGADDFVGTLDVTEIVRGEINRNPLLRSFRVSWGIA